MIRTVFSRASLARVGMLLLAVYTLSACSSAYYSTLEKFGIEKRDVLVDRVEDVTEAQEEGQEEFADALEEFRSVLSVPSSELSDAYDRIKSAYEDSADAADEIKDRIESVESVAEKLFEEWDEELKQYSNANLRNQSAQQLRDTKTRYAKMLGQMHQSRSRLDPVLSAMKDQVLFLKHNLNSQALGSLSSEVRRIDTNVNDLIRAMEASIKESKSFVAAMSSN